MAENTPDIRFGGFADDWKHSKIGDVITEKKRPVGLGDNITYQLITVKRRNEGIVSRGFLKGKQILVKNYFEVKAGDYVISKRQVVHGANGIVPEKLDGAIVSNEYLVAIENNYITTEFLTLISKLPDMYKKFFISSYGIDIEKLVFDVDDWKKRKISIPDKDEQNKITAFFKDFYKLYAAEQQKYDKLVNFKKSMLDKMFPKNGEKIPEIRFGGINGEWKYHKLEDVADIVGGGTPSTVNADYWNGDVDWYSPTEIGDTVYANGSQRKITVEGLKSSSAKILPAGKTVLFTSRASIGDMAILVQPGATNQGFQSLVLKNGYDIYFIYSLGFLIKRYAIKYASGSTFLEVSSKTLKAMDVLIPEFPEQTKIGEFFKNLDAQITLQKEKLEKLTNIKKAFIEKMFL
jgi:type I restriction enzyme S subunit